MPVSAKIFVVTPNPELINLCQSDRELLKVVNSATLAAPDGVGITFAWRFLGLSGEPSLLKGREIFYGLVKLANKKGWRVSFLGDKTAEGAKNTLLQSLKGLEIQAEEGPWLDSKGNPLNPEENHRDEEVISKINKFRPHILFVGFNAPKQEKWVYKWLPKLDVGSAMVVGGTFDYFAGKATLPPKWMEDAGLEWLWRLIRQPRRIGRIFNAVIVFPIRVVLNKVRRA
jgi:N-acetylglucosaminyldiphosphoundecaprenol N-acetyl-beta-D-mannosaminyltransferase